MTSSRGSRTRSTPAIRLGLRPNALQFTLLALDNVFVGMLVGSERTVVPLLGVQAFAVGSLAVLLTFVTAFGIVKGPLNLVAGRLADRWGRRPVLLIGWLCGLPVPWMLLFAPSWSWIVAANLLLGANQGFAWSMTVTSKIDLVGGRQRGLALGINEFSGYVGVALASAATGALASHFGLRPAPFIFAGAVSLAGVLLVTTIRETTPFARLESALRSASAASGATTAEVFALVSWSNRTLRACSQAGLLNKFSDTAVWAVVPVAMASQRFAPDAIGLVVGLYALCWGAVQLVTGALSDRIGRKPPIAAGLALNGAGLLVAGTARSEVTWFGAAALMGVGTALLYPVLLAAVSDVTDPAVRGTALGVYRLWRDGGYALGGVFIGFAAGWLRPGGTFLVLGALLLLSALLVLIWMSETHAWHPLAPKGDSLT
ncbi:MAG: MFS transporter [bacterium]|nr:MFS transporter [bacterium]